jgi:PBP1b-binding outer membrane lipoprotein LpoB
MKKIIFSAAIIAFLLVSCKDKETTNPSQEMENDGKMMNNDSTMMDKDSTMMDNSKMMGSTVYACPMHPEVQGKLNDKCPKCGMKLTEPVLEKTQ